MSSPAPAATPRSVRVLRILVIAVLAGGLALAAGIGIGRYAMGSRIADVVGHRLPDDGWADGAARTWEAAIAPDAEVFSAGGRLIAVTRARSNDANATLTAYTIEDDGLSEAWTTTVDLSQGTLAQDNPQFLRWGDHHLIHGSTVIDLTTGDTSSGPWPADEQPIVAQDVVIACSTTDNNCAAWREGSDEQLWSIPVEDVSTFISRDNNSQTVYRRAGARYIILLFHKAVNLDTGEVVPLDLPSLKGYYLVSAADGWLVHSTGTSGSVVYAFGLEGGEAIDTYTDNDLKTHGKNSVTFWVSEPLPLSAYRAMWRDGDTSNVAARFTYDSDDCIPRIDVVDGASITMPDPTSTINSNASMAKKTCISKLRVPTDRSLLMTATPIRLESNSFSFLFNASTGEQIAFEGVDVNAGGQLTLVRPDLIVGYDSATGTVRAFAPKS